MGALGIGNWELGTGNPVACRLLLQMQGFFPTCSLARGSEYWRPRHSWCETMPRFGSLARRVLAPLGGVILLFFWLESALRPPAGQPRPRSAGAEVRLLDLGHTVQSLRVSMASLPRVGEPGRRTGIIDPTIVDVGSLYLQHQAAER